MKLLHMLSWLLVIIGALNWGLIGAFDYNLVMKILGSGSLASTVYILVGLAAVFKIFTHGKYCRLCKGGKM